MKHNILNRVLVQQGVRDDLRQVAVQDLPRDAPKHEHEGQKVVSVTVIRLCR